VRAALAQDRDHDLRIHLVVLMDHFISELRHLHKAGRDYLGNDPVFPQHQEAVGVTLWRP
jgi:hypothetical protein